MNKPAFNQAGFSLLEVLLYLGVVALMAGGISTFWFLVVNSQIKSENQAEVEQQGAQVLQTMLLAVEDSSIVSNPIPGTGSDVLVLSNEVEYRFVLQDGQLFKQQNAHPLIPLTSSRVRVENLAFQNVATDADQDTIQVRFNIQATEDLGRDGLGYEQEYQGATTVYR